MVIYSQIYGYNNNSNKDDNGHDDASSSKSFGKLYLVVPPAKSYTLQQRW